MSKYKKAGWRGTLITKLKKLTCVYVFLTSDIYSIMNLEIAVVVIALEVLPYLVWTRSVDWCDFAIRCSINEILESKARTSKCSKYQHIL